MDQIDRQQLVMRLQKIAGEMDAIVRDIGPKWIKLAHLRTEARSISESIERDDARPRD
jgi:hypothetical protein